MVELILHQGDPKKRSIVYEGDGEGFHLSLYVPRKVLEKLGYPEELRLTLDKVGKE